MNKHLLTLAKVGLAACVLWWLVHSGQLDPTHMVEAGRRGWPRLVAANLLYACTIAITITRWRLLTRVQGIALTWSDAIRLSFVGYFFNTVMPGAVGGDLVKAVYVAREQPDRRAEAITAILVDRVMGVSGMITVAGLAMLVNLGFVLSRPDTRQLATTILAAFVGLAACASVFLSRRFRSWGPMQAVARRLPLREKLRQVYEALVLYKSHPGAVAAAALLSVVNWLILVYLCFHLSRAIGFDDVPLLKFYLIIPLAQVGNALSPTPSGWGGGEWAFVVCFAVAMGWPLDPEAPGFNGRPAEIAALQHLCVLLWGMAGLVFYLRGRKEIAEAVQVAGGGGG